MVYIKYIDWIIPVGTHQWRVLTIIINLFINIFLMKQYKYQKQYRLKKWNYTNNGFYFITICTYNKINYLTLNYVKNQSLVYIKFHMLNLNTLLVVIVLNMRLMRS